MTDLISLDITGDKQLVESLDSLYPWMANGGVQAANAYLVDNLNEYARGAPYNYLSWAAGGPGSFGGFFSEAQRRFVMASMADGSMRVPYQRMGNNPYHTEGEGSEQVIVSDDPAMFYSMSDEGQARMQAMRGWEKISLILHDREADIRNAFEKGVVEAVQIQGKLQITTE